VIVAGLSFLVSVVFILGFVYHIELCAAAAILACPRSDHFPARLPHGAVYLRQTPGA
jgi:hypothetical protein